MTENGRDQHQVSTLERCPLRDGWLYQASARKTPGRGRGLSFF